MECWERLELPRCFPLPVSLPVSPLFSEPPGFWGISILEEGDPRMHGGAVRDVDGGEEEAGVHVGPSAPSS